MRAAGAGGSETHFTVQVVSKEFEGKVGISTFYKPVSLVLIF